MAALLGLVVGLVLGLTGAGGSVLAVPLLIAGLGWPITLAATVALLAVAASATLGTTLAWGHSYLRYRAALLMAFSGACTSPLGLRVADHLPVGILGGCFAAVLVVVAARMYRSSRQADAGVVRASVAGDGAPAQGHLCALDPGTGRLLWTARTWGVMAAIGAVTGLLSGLLGVGGGFVIVPALRGTTPLSMHSAVATSLMTIALTSISTLIWAEILGRSLPWGTALPFIAGALAGMFGGRLLAPRIAGPALQRGFSVTTLLAAGFMALHSL
ncbi:MAG: sulfite exporter TauE/SafE family protein [Proteobacteria bacterium]|nr:sulfite exporter TauE/SafE family protein [Pseudomonadota bacterium]